MIDMKKINELVQGVMEGLPPGLKTLPKDVEENLRSALQGAFHKMDLVTREEFDAQANVLERTRAKLESLEQKIAQLEDEESTPK